jgi:hypothetical protein
MEKSQHGGTDNSREHDYVNYADLRNSTKLTEFENNFLS